MFPYIHLGPIAISSYFLVISLAATIGAIWFLNRTENRDLPKILMIDLTLVCLIGGFAGARLLHIFFEAPEIYRAEPLKALEIWNGGFVFLGGVIGGALSGFVFCVWRRLPSLLLADLAAIPLSFAYALGRIACFLNGCCYGRTCELPWAISLNGERRHPTQLYASFWEFVVLAILIKSESRLKTPGRLLGLWLILHSIGRIIMEIFRDDPRGEMIGGFSLGTWLSAALIILGVILLMPREDHLVSEMHH